MPSLLHFLLAIALIQCANAVHGPVVRTKNGLVRGIFNSTVWNSVKFSSFKGIPYAKPPLGPLRFQPPVPMDPWEGTLDAIKEGNECTQYNILIPKRLGGEDCLYINVYTPVTDFSSPPKLRPVMFWIYGGAYIVGYGDPSVYGPDYLIEQDVVLVTFNYRLGALGFLALDHPKMLGNAGLKDQRLALEWMNQNIAAFGGDPNQVTVFGHSAGAASIDFHAMSPRSRGLFSRSIQMSGSALCPWGYNSPTEAHKVTRGIATALGYVVNNDEELYHLLMRLPAMELANATEILEQIMFIPVRPTIENVTLDFDNTAIVTQCPIAQFERGEFKKMPRMMGFVTDEMASFLFAFVRIFGNHTQLEQEPVTPLLSALLKEVKGVVDLNNRALVDVLSKYLFVSSVDLLRKMVNEHNNGLPVYYYLESFKSPNPFHQYLLSVHYDGVGHMDDLQDIFSETIIPEPKDPNDPYRKFQLELVTMYANFAKYGNPTPKDNNPINVEWVPSGPLGVQLDLNTEFSLRPIPVDLSTILIQNGIKTMLQTTSECH